MLFAIVVNLDFAAATRTPFHGVVLCSAEGDYIIDFC